MYHYHAKGLLYRHRKNFSIFCTFLLRCFPVDVNAPFGAVSGYHAGVSSALVDLDFIVARGQAFGVEYRCAVRLLDSDIHAADAAAAEGRGAGAGGEQTHKS